MPTAARDGARPRRRSSTARPPRPCSPRSTSTRRTCRRMPSTSRRASATGSWRCAAIPRRAWPSPPRCMTSPRSGPACRCTASGASTPRARRSPPSPSASTPARRCRPRCARPRRIPILKVKLGTDRDVEILRALREVTDREIRVDANCAWTARQAIAHAPGARGVRRHGARAAGGAHRSRRLRAHPRARQHADHRRRELQDGRRHPGAGGQGGRHQHQARQVRQPARGDPHGGGGPYPSPAGHARAA